MQFNFSKPIVLVLVFIIGLLASEAAAVYRTDLGRWTRRDPAGYADGMNRYDYARSSPIRHVDPSGLIAAGDFTSDAEVISVPAPPDDIYDYPEPSIPAPPKQGFELCCNHIPGTLIASHCYIRYTDLAGRQWGCRGGPTPPSGTAEEKLACKSPFLGDPPIHAYCQRWTEDFIDHVDYPVCKRVIGLTTYSQEWACIQAMMKSITGCCLTYHLLGPNSNTVISAALQRCLGYTPASLPRPPLGVPVGWDLGQQFLLDNKRCGFPEAPVYHPPGTQPP